MTQVYVKSAKITAIADVVRTKTGTTAAMTLDNVVESINGMAEGGCTTSNLITRNIRTVTADDLEGVTAIRRCAFMNNTSLTSISFPDTVSSIGYQAFTGCSSLNAIVFPSSVTAIDEHAFSSCKSLASIHIPGSVSTVGGFAFSGCSSLASITVGDGVQILETAAFQYCPITSIVIPSSVTKINGPFDSCTSLDLVDLSAYGDPDAVPEGAANSIFYNCPLSDGIILKNSEMYEAFKVAKSWKNYADKMIYLPITLIWLDSATEASNIQTTATQWTLLRRLQLRVRRRAQLKRTVTRSKNGMREISQPLKVYAPRL